VTLRPEYRLGHSEYNGFLHACVGVGKTGAELTVISAFTRLGVDPWQEAARLSEMPKDTAVRALAAILAALPEGAWQASQGEAICARLVTSLPGRSTGAIPSPTRRRGRQRTIGDKMRPNAKTWLAWGVLAVALLLLVLHFQTDNNLEPASGDASSTQQ
jgi:hypothetical protein